MMSLPARVTAAFCANNRPSIIAPDPRSMAVSARTFPPKIEEPPSVAELPTCQKVFSGTAPPVNRTWLPVAVMRVDDILKMKMALASPLRVIVPVMSVVVLAMS